MRFPWSKKKLQEQESTSNPNVPSKTPQNTTQSQPILNSDTSRDPLGKVGEKAKYPPLLDLPYPPPKEYYDDPKGWMTRLIQNMARCKPLIQLDSKYSKEQKERIIGRIDDEINVWKEKINRYDEIGKESARKWEREKKEKELREAEEKRQLLLKQENPALFLKVPEPKKELNTAPTGPLVGLPELERTKYTKSIFHIIGAEDKVFSNRKLMSSLGNGSYEAGCARFKDLVTLRIGYVKEELSNAECVALLNAGWKVAFSKIHPPGHYILYSIKTSAKMNHTVLITEVMYRFKSRVLNEISLIKDDSHLNHVIDLIIMLWDRNIPVEVQTSLTSKSKCLSKILFMDRSFTEWIVLVPSEKDKKFYVDLISEYRDIHKLNKGSVMSYFEFIDYLESLDKKVAQRIEQNLSTFKPSPM